MELKRTALPDIKGDCYVSIPFLFEPILLELKKRFETFSLLKLEINKSLFPEFEVLTGVFRLFGHTLKLKKRENRVVLNYGSSIIEIQFSEMKERLKGHMELEGVRWVFSSAIPFIEKEPFDENNPVIVLPEGDGAYYMELDKRESEEGNRLSIIAPPEKMKALYASVKELIGG